MAGKNHGFDRVVLVLQGGGARGAYHLGVYKAMEEAGYTPDVFCGISIGALSACVLAGNDPSTRYAKLEEFWNEITWPEFMDTSKVPMTDAVKKWHNQMSSLQAIMFGQPNFFTPWFPPPKFQAKGTSAATSYYDTSKLKDTLTRLSNFDMFNKQKKTRLITGATQIKSGELVFFDSENMPLNVDHVVASGSLPPGFPGTTINGDLYWDGGALSNSPIEAVFSMKPEMNTLVFMIDLFNGACPDPQDLDEVSWVSSELMFASRTSHNIQQYAHKHNLKKALSHLIKKVPDNSKNDPIVKEIAGMASDVNLHFVHVVYNSPATDSNNSGHEFSRTSVKERAGHGYEDMKAALKQADWLKPHPAHEGSKIHRYMNPTRR